jgi:hypothetical protein
MPSSPRSAFIPSWAAVLRVRGASAPACSVDNELDERVEPSRDCRRPFGLSYAAIAGCFSMA